MTTALNLRTIRMTKGVVLVLLYVVFPVLLMAQSSAYIHPNQQPQKAAIWYFGDQAGLDFSGGAPVAITNSAMQTFEGSSVVSDDQGQLQFYTNGGAMPYPGGIWNRNHQLMPNGNLNGTNGCNSAFQSSLIVNQPRKDDVYYLFTVDCIENNSTGGLRYSVVDMNLDGGLGDVIVKDQLLGGPMDESLTAIQHANGQDWWIVTHRITTDSFYCYHLSGHGIEGIVKTQIGNQTPAYAGSLVASSNGEKLVYSGLNWTSLFDFNAETGVISNHIDLGIASYSAAFSPNCSFIYLADGVGATVYQVEVKDQTLTPVIVGGTSSTGFGGMATGPDGRIYLARFVSSLHLGVIENPNVKGPACSYVDNGIGLGGRLGKGGLPNFPNNMIGGCAAYGDINPWIHNNQQFNFVNQNAGTNNIHLEWASMDGASSYRVYHRPTGAAYGWSHLDVVEADVELTDLEAQTAYQIKVIPVYTDQTGYEPVTDHFFEDVVARHGGVASKTDDNEIELTTTNNLDFDLFPNPTNGDANIAMTLDGNAEEIQMNVINLSGQVVMTKSYTATTGYNNFTVETAALSNGVYKVMLQNENVSAIKKLVLMK